MKYMVMECQFSYAVVLDEEGNFLTVANRHYHVGQMVTDVIEMKTPDIQEQPVKKMRHKWICSVAAMAACLVLAAMPMLRMGQTPYASVYMAINPEVRIDVNRKDVVVGLEGTNADGGILIEDYSYKKKPLDLVMDELVDKAIEDGFLHEGGRITLTLDAEDGAWVVSRGETLGARLDEHLSEKMSVTIEVKDTALQKHEVIIPVAPETVQKTPGHGVSGNSSDSLSDNQADAAAGNVIVGDSRYDDGRSDYGNNGSSSYKDGQSGYDGNGMSHYEDDSQSNYMDSDNGGLSAYNSPYDAGQSGYGEPVNTAPPVINAPVSNTPPTYHDPGNSGQTGYDGQSNYNNQSNYDSQSNYGQSSYDSQSDYDD